MAGGVCPEKFEAITLARAIVAAERRGKPAPPGYAERLAELVMQTDTSDTAVTIGMRLGRRLFQTRGNHSEVHLSEMELAALLALAAQAGIDLHTLTGKVNEATEKDLTRPKART
jgi:hypothetical protein